MGQKELGGTGKDGVGTHASLSLCTSTWVLSCCDFQVIVTSLGKHSAHVGSC